MPYTHELNLFTSLSAKNSYSALKPACNESISLVSSSVYFCFSHGSPYYIRLKTILVIKNSLRVEEKCRMSRRNISNN